MEGFFTNGGKRVYITRVLNLPQVQNAEMFLFDRGTPTTAATRLLHQAVGPNNTRVFVVDGAGLAAGDWLQIDAGAAVEYRQINASPSAANAVVPADTARFQLRPGRRHRGC